MPCLYFILPIAYSTGLHCSTWESLLGQIACCTLIFTYYIFFTVLVDPWSLTWCSGSHALNTGMYNKSTICRFLNVLMFSLQKSPIYFNYFLIWRHYHQDDTPNKSSYLNDVIGGERSEEQPPNPAKRLGTGMLQTTITSWIFQFGNFLPCLSFFVCFLHQYH